MGSYEQGGLLISSIPLPSYVRAIHGPLGAALVDRNFKAFGEFPADELEAQRPAGDSMSEVADTMSEPPLRIVSKLLHFLRDAPIVILDEPTSALDAGTKADLMELMERLRWAEEVSNELVPGERL